MVAAGNLAGQIITIGSAPILSRLYSPAEFGVLATVSAIATIGAVLAPLTLHQAVHVPRDPTDAIALVRVSLNITALFCALYAGLAAVVCWSSGALQWAYVPIAAGASAVVDVLCYWATREGLFTLLVQSRLIGAVCGVGAMCLLSSWDVFGLLTGNTLGALASAAWLLTRFLRTATPRPNRPMRSILAQYRHFPLWRLPAGLLNTALNQMPLWMFSHVFGATVVGQYSLVQRAFNAPTVLVGSATNDVFQREAGQALRTRGECRAEFGRFAILLIGVGGSIALIIAAFGPPLFAAVFGEPWRDAGEMARWLALLFALRFVLSPLSALLIIAGRAGWDLVLQVWLLVGTAATWVVAVQTRSVSTTIVSLTVVAAMFYGANTVIARWIATGRLPACTIAQRNPG